LRFLNIISSSFHKKALNYFGMSENLSLNQEHAVKALKNVRYQQWRLIKDRIAHYGVVVGGLGVIVAIVLIFFYLLYVVLPLFESASTSEIAHYDLPEKNLGKTLLLTSEEQNEVAARFTDFGNIIFFDLASGKPVLTHQLAIAEGVKVSGFAQGKPINQDGFAFGLSDGKVILGKVNYQITYNGDKRQINPQIKFPFGEQAIVIDEAGAPIEKIALRLKSDATVIAAQVNNAVNLIKLNKEQSLFSDTATVTRSESKILLSTQAIEKILIDKEGTLLYLLDNEGLLSVYDINDINAVKLKYQEKVVTAGDSVTSMVFLNGDLSLLIGDSKGKISQWSQVKNQLNQNAIKKIRQFELSNKPVYMIDSEQRRKGFVAGDNEGNLALFNSTSERKLVTFNVGSTATFGGLSPRANRLVVETGDGKIHALQIFNEHPEVSIKSLWQKVWYESYSKPAFIWQSSSASNDFEPKYSLTPLVFGTLKAAFYAMLFALPLALMGAIYTAYFMAPQMRQLVKPTIELMGALPTVIIGFLAGLWLAPFIEKNLAGLCLTLITLPISVLIFALLWQLLPEKIRQQIPEGWDCLVLMPVLIAITWLAFAISVPLETFLFNGSLRDWFNREFGIGYDQRNAIVVGVAMGFAVIPTIFSIAEDAIFSVPKHLTVGSLALGATPWQTMTRVVLLTASPGIFSAVMIGLGRAIGETMIVLMATGNTPVMDFSVFQGLRTLAANIAVEMPESEVDSTHYRVLFLAALVLFLATFMFNTLAEVIRQRLREKYSSL
jgi:phosphate transport system permease protein